MKKERLTKRVGDGIQYDNGEYIVTCYPKNNNLSDVDRMAVKLCELEDKIENGTLLELPCKVGDTAYRITRLYNGEIMIVEGMVFEFAITHESSQRDKYRFYFWGKADTNYASRQYSKWCEFTDFGKTVFLSCEEAEKELAERSNL